MSPPVASGGRHIDARHTISLLPFILSLGILNDVNPVFDTAGQRGVKLRLSSSHRKAMSLRFRKMLPDPCPSITAKEFNIPVGAAATV